MSSDTKITIHEQYAEYCRRWAALNHTSVKAVIEDLIEGHVLPELRFKGATKGLRMSWADCQVAANRLLPKDWFLEPCFRAPDPKAGGAPGLFLQLDGGDAFGPVFTTGDALRQFSDELRSVAVVGGRAELETVFPKIGTNVCIRRRGSALVFESEKGKTTVATRFSDKIIEAFELAILSQELKSITY
jgi:hypothetical protein